MADAVMMKSGGYVDLEAVTARAEDVLAGKVIVDAEGNPLAGTMPDKGDWSSLSLAAGVSVTIPEGHHSGSGKVSAKDLASQTDGNAAAADIRKSKKAWVKGKQLTGTMAEQGGSTVTPGTANKTAVSANRYVTGNVIVSGDKNLVAANIVKGKTIFGVAGTAYAPAQAKSDIYNRGNNPGKVKPYETSGGVYAAMDSTQISDTSYGGAILAVVFNTDFSSYKKLNVTVFVNKVGGGTKISYLTLFRGTGLNTSKEVAEVYFTDSVTANKEISVSLNVEGLQIKDTWTLKYYYSQGDYTGTVFSIRRIWLS